MTNLLPGSLHHITSHYFIIMKVSELSMKVSELSVKAQGEGEYSRLGMFSIMNASGLSCKRGKGLLLFFHTLFTMLCM